MASQLVGFVDWVLKFFNDWLHLLPHVESPAFSAVDYVAHGYIGGLDFVILREAHRDGEVDHGYPVDSLNYHGSSRLLH